MGRLFGTDGIRGIFGDDLNTALARYVGRALVRVLREGGKDRPTVLIGMDTRLSSSTLADSVLEGVSEAGGDVAFLDVCSTPAVAYLIVKHGYDAGVMISASHNPWEYNGIKIFGGDGFKLNDELEAKIEDIILDEDEDFSPAIERGGMTVLFDGVKEYSDYIVSCCGRSLEGIRVAIDCANGSASVSAEDIFTRLGAECTMIADKPNGMNINKDCGSTHLEVLRRTVLEGGLDLGIAFDGDADRCLAIDGDGREIDGDFILAILASKLKSEGKLKGSLVGTVMSNLGLIKFCEENGIEFLATKVGDRYVLEALNERGLALGGEQSGHIILRELSTTGDGQLTAAILLSAIKESGKSLSALATVMKKYPQYMINVHADANDKAAFKEDSLIKEIIAESERKMASHGRILIRPSGTEHLIRVMTEGDDPTLAEDICRELAKNIEKRLAELK